MKPTLLPLIALLLLAPAPTAFSQSKTIGTPVPVQQMTITKTVQPATATMTKGVAKPVPVQPAVTKSTGFFPKVYQKIKKVVSAIFSTLTNQFGKTSPPAGVCGNHVLDAGEYCDDGNTVSGDGCSASCQCEFNGLPTYHCPSICGDGIITYGEVCDNGTLNSDTVPDACRTNCKPAYCGDGVVDPGSGEECDGSAPAGMACDSFCHVKSTLVPCYMCVTSGVCTLIESDPSTCALFFSEPTCGGTCVPPSPVCGNGIVEPGETCDGSPPPGSPSGTTCSSTCTIVPPPCAPLAASRGKDSSEIGKVMAKLPLNFVENQGQLDPQVKEYVREKDHAIFFANKEVAYGFPNTLIREKFVGANPQVKLKGAKPALGKVNYLVGKDKGNWKTNIPTYEEVVYEDLYPGIDLVFAGSSGRLKSEFRVAAGVDYKKILLAYDGMDEMKVSDAGDLVLQTAAQELRELRPTIYQEIDGKRVEVEGGRYVVKGKQSRFELGRYNPAYSLIIDPVLTYSTYLGGSSGEQGNGIAVDSECNIYVTGDTLSTNFPTTASAFQPAYAGGEDTFVVIIGD